MAVRRLVPTLIVVVALLLAACSPVPPATGCGTFGAYVNAFPTPVSSLTSVFGDVDDDFLEVAFTGDFEFPFYGESYASVFLNTNGGMTFGAGDDDFDLAAIDVLLPGIAVFWGDLDAAAYEGANRANQMRWRQSASCFEVAYAAHQDNDDATWANTATVTMANDGEIEIVYGTVGSEDILVGVFDGTHTDDRYPALGTVAYDLSASGTGVILFDSWDAGPDHTGELTGRTVVYRP